MSTAALKKYIGTGGGSTDYMNYITEYNVSVQHPTSGIGGSNKYSLEGAIAQVPQELGRREAGMFQMRLLGLVHDHQYRRCEAYQ